MIVTKKHLITLIVAASAVIHAQAADLATQLQGYWQPDMEKTLALAKKANREMDPMTQAILGKMVFEFQDDMLSATVVDGKATFLRWWYEGEEFEAWSNVDFNHFSGFAEFEAGEKLYAFMMAVGNFSSAGDRNLAWPGKPPELGVDYPAFTISKGDTSKVVALAAMVSMHDLYENEREKLVAAHVSRVSEQAKQVAWLKSNPPKPKDPVIQFWRREAPNRANH